MKIGLAATLLLVLCAACSSGSPSYRGAHFGSVLGAPQASLSGLRAFTADRSASIRHPFNESFCSECHSIPTTGGSQFLAGDFAIKEERNGRASTYQRYALVHGIVTFRKLPAHYYVRRPQPLYGIGLLEAIPVSELRDVAADQSRLTPQHKGKLAILSGGNVGRFGWKAAFPDIRAFVTTALSTEIGTSAKSADVSSITTYLTRLAAPPSGNAPQSAQGRELFERIGCADCHRPSMHIGSFAAVPALSGATIQPYTDLLLHDMGSQGADVAEGSATASQFRTPPLWGIAKTGPPYLHDGRAGSLSQAIALHGGQARDSAERYGALPIAQQNEILRFLRSL